MTLTQLLSQNTHQIQSILPEALRYHGICRFDASETNPIFAGAIDPAQALADYLQRLQNEHRLQTLIGGYAEKRSLYPQESFEDRCIHLGIDIALSEGTEVLCPLNARIYGFSDHPQRGDYGPVIILQHALEQHTFYSLYGHLSRTDLIHLTIGQAIAQGEIIGHIGSSAENGGWPPHLHLQLIEDIGEQRDDYPGVCTAAEKDYYLKNCPDPELLIIP